MRQMFISYARENKGPVDGLVEDIEALGHQAWMDTNLRGGQAWWDEILARITACDVFVAIVSGKTLTSVACQREKDWAAALGKPILPIAVERLPGALPRDLSVRQIVDYSQPGRQAIRDLAAAVAALQAPPALPDPLPQAPPAPLSYLNDLVGTVSQHEQRLTYEQQHEILTTLQPALDSTDAEERASGRYVIELFSQRPDLYADVSRQLAQMRGRLAEPTGQDPPPSRRDISPPDRHSRPASHPEPTAPPGWYPDPSGRHEWRWFERDWTDHVADGGAWSLDPC